MRAARNLRSLLAGSSRLASRLRISLLISSPLDIVVSRNPDCCRVEHDLSFSRTSPCTFEQMEPKEGPGRVESRLVYYQMPQALLAWPSDHACWTGGRQSIFQLLLHRFQTFIIPFSSQARGSNYRRFFHETFLVAQCHLLEAYPIMAGISEYKMTDMDVVEQGTREEKPNSLSPELRNANRQPATGLEVYALEGNTPCLRS